MVEQIAIVTKTITHASTPPAFTEDFASSEITETFTFAILLWSRANDSADNAHGHLGMCFIAPDPGATQQAHSLGFYAQDGLSLVGAGGRSNCGVSHSNGSLVVPDPTSADGTALEASALYDSTIAGGVRLNFTAWDAGGLPDGLRVTAILFAGFDRGYTDGCTALTIEGLEPVGAAASRFRPTGVIFGSTDTSLTGNSIDCSPNVGFALDDGGPSQITAYVNADDIADPTDSDGILHSTRAYLMAPTRTAGVLDIQTAQVTSFAATGFNLLSSAGSPDAHYLAFKASSRVRLAIAHMPIAATTGLQSFNAFGFTPDLVFGMATLLAALDSQTDGATAAASAYIVTGRHGSRAITWHHREGLVDPGTTDAHTRAEDVALLQYDHEGNVVQRATWAGGSGSGGFALDFSVASEAGYMTVLGIQIIPSPPLVQRRRVVRRARARYARRPVLIQGTPPVSTPPLGRLMQAIVRQRWKIRRRLLWRPRPVPTVAPEVGLAVLNPTGAVMSPGLLRGRVVGPGVASPEPP